jgi:hypothetical protein
VEVLAGVPRVTIVWENESWENETVSKNNSKSPGLINSVLVSVGESVKKW